MHSRGIRKMRSSASNSSEFEIVRVEMNMISNLIRRLRRAPALRCYMLDCAWSGRAPISRMVIRDPRVSLERTNGALPYVTNRTPHQSK